MGGRLVASLVADFGGWRFAIAAVGVAGLAMAEGFRRLAPPSRNFRPSAGRPAALVRDARALFTDRAMPLLYLEAFLLMGVFVTIYNYAGFRLMSPPYSLSQAAVGGVFLLYVLGSVSSAKFGTLAGRLGRRKVFWIPVVLLIAGVALTAMTPLLLVIAGIAVVTIGFFGAHSIASAWVGRRAQGVAGGGRAELSSSHSECDQRRRRRFVMLRGDGAFRAARRVS